MKKAKHFGAVKQKIAENAGYKVSVVSVSLLNQDKDNSYLKETLARDIPSKGFFGKFMNSAL